jgi:hypothetical protein
VTNPKIIHDDSDEISDPHLLDQVARGKAGRYASICQVKYCGNDTGPFAVYSVSDIDDTDTLLFKAWFVLMAVAVTVRIFLVQAIDLKGDKSRNFKLLNWAVGIVTLVWGMAAGPPLCQPWIL